jgi:hypothetical protein
LSVTSTGWWFSSGTPVSSTNKTDRHDITEILLKVALNTINQPTNLPTNQPINNALSSWRSFQNLIVYTKQNKLKSKYRKHHNVGTVIKSKLNRKIGGKNNYPSTRMHHRWLSWLGVCTSIKCCRNQATFMGPNLHS